MKLGIIIETNEPEKEWNRVRFGNAALKQGHEVKIFLISAGVVIPSTYRKTTILPFGSQAITRGKSRGVGNENPIE